MMEFNLEHGNTIKGPDSDNDFELELDEHTVYITRKDLILMLDLIKQKEAKDA